MPIVIQNQSTEVSDADVTKAVAAIQIQVNRDLYPQWRVRANLVAPVKGFKPPPNSWIITITDDPSVAVQGALGYHEEKGGLPIGYVFPGLDAKYGLSWTTTLSHEVLEALVDPLCQNVVLQQTGPNAGRLVPVEVGDPCESDDCSYLIDGIKVSDFAYPSWWDATLAPGSTKFDHTGHCPGPFQVAAGGYLSVLPVTWSGDWVDVNNQGQPKPGGADPDDRRGERFKPRSLWHT